MFKIYRLIKCIIKIIFVEFLFRKMGVLLIIYKVEAYKNKNIQKYFCFKPKNTKRLKIE